MASSPPARPVFSDAIKQIDELLLFVELSWAGLDYAKSATTIENLLAEIPGDDRGSKPTPDRIEHLKKLEEFALAELPKGFPYLYGIAVIRLWTILEVLVQDVLTDLITKPEVRNLPQLRKLKGPLLDFADAPTPKQAELMLNLLLDEIGAPLKRGVGRFESLFEAIGLDGAVDSRARRYILELSEVRNVIVHRGGIADERLVSNCPWLGLQAGAPVKLTHEHFIRYLASAQWYVYEIAMRGAVKYQRGDFPFIKNLQRRLLLRLGEEKTDLSND